MTLASKKITYVSHNLYSCHKINPFISKVFKFLTDKCSEKYSISEVEYLLGYPHQGNEGLNCALLELKQYIFYNFSSDKSLTLQFNLYLNRLRRLIIKEKRYYLSLNKLDYFYEKWLNFSAVYLLHGPDPHY